MELLVDTHTHTVGSVHAFSTLMENARAAFEKGLQGFATTDHGPAIEGCPPRYMISSVMRFLPDYIENVRVIKGVECNIIDYDGGLDIPNSHLQYTEFAIASMHDITIERGGIEENTAALLGALENPFVDVIGHPGNANYPIDKEAFVKAVARQGKLVEVNNHSFEFRRGSWENCTEIIKLCKKHDVRITVGSDAHFCGNIGSFELAKCALTDCGYPEEMIVSANIGRFLDYIRERRAKHPLQER